MKIRAQQPRYRDCYQGSGCRAIGRHCNAYARWKRSLALAAILVAGALVGRAASALPVPERLVVLTFDDAVKSHRTFVAPLLQELGFNATFFVTHKWMSDEANFMTWDEIGELHRMGFEIGNHSWTHANFSQPKNAARIAGELSLVERALGQAKDKPPKPVSFAWCGNSFGPEAVQRLGELGYRFARRGGEPEARFGTLEVGPSYDPKRHHPLLIPTTGNSYPGWTLEHFKQILARATKGKIVVLQFHGAPDVAHPWVHTPPESFREYMTYLKENNYRCIAVRDLEPYIDWNNLPDDPNLKRRQQNQPPDPLVLPVEMLATRTDPRFWLENMLVHHRYTRDEVARVFGWSVAEVERKAAELSIQPDARLASWSNGVLRVLPYPGGREVRRGFTDGNIDFQRGTKASVFLPWDPTSYVVVDLPEAIFWSNRLLFLAHTHIPTIWDDDNVVLDNIDWRREPDGRLQWERVLPNKVVFGASILPRSESVEMELWLRNGSDALLGGLRTQVCVHLKGAAGFDEQTRDNKIFRPPSAAVHSAGGDRWILTAWERCGRAWGNALVPCLHADPVLADCATGETVRVRGRLWFYEGKDPAAELERASAEFR